VNGYEESDPLAGTPPVPPLRSAAPGASGTAAPAGPSAAALAMTGTVEVSQTIQEMKMLEDLVMKLTKKLPELAGIAAPFIEQMRSHGAAALASAAQGGLPVSQDLGAAGPPGAMGAMGAMGGGMPPMPPPPAGAF
jgi:hypothetical protein